MSELLSIKEASKWASKFLNKDVSTSNISYLIQYGALEKIGSNGKSFIKKSDLKSYYQEEVISKEEEWKSSLGEDLNWDLSFSNYKESETTKHVHRLHPYKGKFIPQLVEYFLDDHVDSFKKEVYFQSGDVVLDPFCGSGTTLVQANELNIHAIGIDVSVFNSFLTNVKVGSYKLVDVQQAALRISKKLKSFVAKKNVLNFEQELLQVLKVFNQEHFPSPEYKLKVRKKLIDDKSYGAKYEGEFQSKYDALIEKHSIKLQQETKDRFLDKWYVAEVRDEIDFVKSLIDQIENDQIKHVLRLILSRTIRTSRATTHSDLVSLQEPQLTPYYCRKHGKICKPLFTIHAWWDRYAQDTIKRLSDFNRIKSNTLQYCIQGDSRNVDVVNRLRTQQSGLADLVKQQKISGIFSSPPYVGLIDYHEQHAYAYDLYELQRVDEQEIGPLFRGQGKKAKESYIEGIAAVLKNCKRFMKPDYNVFLVANDKHNLYPEIASRAHMKIVNQYLRPVLNRGEKNRGAYSEIIFHMKESED